jgi:hypothetical protein
VLERYARSLIKRHNTFYRGVFNTDANGNQLSSNAFNEAQLAQFGALSPTGAAGETFITPNFGYSSFYGHPVEIMRPFHLGPDRTKWFIEGDFNISTIANRNGLFNGIGSPWVTKSEVLNGSANWPETELVGVNQKFIP